MLPFTSQFKSFAFIRAAAILGVFLFCQAQPACAQDIVHGQLIQFTDNGAWSWYQDERVVVDQAHGKLLVSSLANRFGVGGQERDGDVDVTIYDLNTGRRDTQTLRHGLVSYGGGDDHNLAALLVRPDGKYLAMYAGHNNDKFSYFRIYSDAKWGPEQRFDWNSISGGSDFQTTYSNLFFLSDTKQTFNFARSHKKSPNLIVSNDMGDTWKYGGLLTQPEESIGYVNGYFKYASNGKDRIDFICTEHHPRDFDTSVYHGYLKNGKIHHGSGKVLDENVADLQASKAAEFFPVIRAGEKSGEIALQHVWVIDLQHYADGTLSAICSARANNSLDDHRFVFARFDGTAWKWSELAKAGAPLFRREEDYTGLGALFPDNPNAIVISTPIHPVTGKETRNHELYRGATSDHGQTWTWSAITEESTVDNLRPVVPAWNKDSQAILWWRGTYRTSQNFDAAVVGLIERSNELRAAPVAMDAAEKYTGLEDGSYEVSIRFWDVPGSDTRLQVTLQDHPPQLCRSVMSQQVANIAPMQQPLVSGGEIERRLYETSLGRVQVSDGSSFTVTVAPPGLVGGYQGIAVTRIRGK